VYKRQKQLKELLLHYASHHSGKLFTLSGKSSGSLNPTIINRIGKKRCGLIQLLLEEFQMKMIWIHIRILRLFP